MPVDHSTEIKELRDKNDALNEKLNLILIWQATVEARLTQGNTTFTDLKEEIKERVEKKLLWAYLLGLATATGGSVAALMKLLGH